MQSVPYAGWVDDRAGRIKQNLPSGSRILVVSLAARAARRET